MKDRSSSMTGDGALIGTSEGICRSQLGKRLVELSVLVLGRQPVGFAYRAMCVAHRVIRSGGSVPDDGRLALTTRIALWEDIPPVGSPKIWVMRVV
jgi:hypothetical protein